MPTKTSRLNVVDALLAEPALRGTHLHAYNLVFDGRRLRAPDMSIPEVVEHRSSLTPRQPLQIGLIGIGGSRTRTLRRPRSVAATERQAQSVLTQEVPVSHLLPELLLHKPAELVAKQAVWIWRRQDAPKSTSFASTVPADRPGAS